MAKRSTIADMIADQDPALMQEEVIIIESITQDTLDPLGRIRYFFGIFKWILFGLKLEFY